MVMLRRDLIDPHCVTPEWIDGIGAMELRNGALHVTYFVEQEDCASGTKVAVVVARHIYPLSALLPGGMLGWVKRQTADAPPLVREMAH